MPTPPEVGPKMPRAADSARDAHPSERAVREQITRHVARRLHRPVPGNSTAGRSPPSSPTPQDPLGGRRRLHPPPPPARIPAAPDGAIRLGEPEWTVGIRGAGQRCTPAGSLRRQDPGALPDRVAALRRAARGDRPAAPLVPPHLPPAARAAGNPLAAALRRGGLGSHGLHEPP